MAYTSLTDLFTAIADSIRAKRGTSTIISAQNFPSQINAIPTATIATKSVTPTSASTSISFSGLGGSPKVFAVILDQSTVVANSSTSSRKIAAAYKLGANGSQYAISFYHSSSGARLSRSSSSTITSSYDSSTATFTITSSSSTNPGQFLNATYTLIYAY